MINIWNYTVFIFVGLIFSSYATAAEKSVGAKLGYDFAHSACEPQSSDCDNQSLSGGIYFRHNIYDPYFYQVSFEYLGRFKSTYPALAHPTMDADYTGDVYGLGLSGGRVFSLAQKHQLVTQLGLMSWYVKTKGDEIDYHVTHDDFGVSPFASVAYQYNTSKNTRIELGYQFVYGVGGDLSGGTNINQVFLGFAYRFGSSDVDMSQTLKSGVSQ